MAVKYVSGRVKQLNVGITSYSEDKVSLDVTGLSTFRGDITLATNQKLNVGTANTVSLWNNGAITRLQGEGDALIYIDTPTSLLVGAAGSGNAALFKPASSVDLYYAGTKRFETAGFGVTVTGTVDATQLNITGVSTFTGIVTTSSDLYIGGDLYVSDDITLDEVTATSLNVSGISTLGITSATDLEAQQLNVSGVSTFTGAIDANGDLDVDGHTELDDVNVSGVTTFAGTIYVNGNIDGDDSTNITGVNSISADDFVGDLSGTVKTASQPSITGLGTLTGLDVNGHSELDNVNVSGAITATTLKVDGTSTFAGNLDIADTIYHTGDSNTKIRFPATDTITFHTSGVERLRINSIGDVNISGTTTTGNLSVSGVSTLGVTSATDLEAQQLNVSGVSTLTGNAFVGSAITMYASSGIVSATKFYGDGSGLENTGAALAEASGTERLVLTNLTSGTMVSAATTSDVTFNAVTDTFHVGSGVTIYGGTTGVVSATSYNGDLTIGTPTGGFKSGAFTINSTDKTKDSINDLNNILGKLVPDPPDTINGVSISLTGTAGNGRLCAGFTPTNNTGGSAPSAGTQYTRNTDSTVSTTYITEYGPGDSGTVTGFVNAVGVGTTTLATGDNDGTYGAIQIANNEDASNSTRNTGIASGFYEIYDLRMINGASPDGYNLAKFTQGSSTTGSVYWYEDPSTVGAPVISFASVEYPSSPSYSYSSGIPHYTESTNNNFTYVMTVTNATGDMYTQNSFVNSDGQTSAFQNPGDKSYTNFASGTNPPARNYGVGTGVTALITQTPRNLHATVTSNIFTSFDASTPYGSHNNQRVGMTTDFNIMGTTADYTTNVDEDAIECTVGSLTGGSATRVKAGATGDNPTPAYTAWTGGSAGSIDTYEAAVRGGDLRHDQTDYSDGSYLPVGPDYSASRSGSQYFQFQFIQASISEFQISYTGSLAGCWVCMPDNSTWTTSLSGVNGWADMFTAYKGSGVPTSAEPGCASGGVMDTNGGTFTCVFGTESSSNDSNNRVLIRFKLTSGNSISNISLSDT